MRIAFALTLILLLLAPSARAQSTLPSEIPLFPLGDVTLFPDISRPFLIFEPRYRAMIADALKGDRIIGMATLKPGFEADYEGRPPIYDVGCAGEIAEYELLPDGRYTIVLRGLQKFRVRSEDNRRPYRLARIEPIAETPKPEELARLSALRERLSTLLLASIPPGAALPPAGISDATFINAAAMYVEVPESTRQQLLERDGLLARAQAVIELLESR
jgi:Lon protease-like protein